MHRLKFSYFFLPTELIFFLFFKDIYGVSLEFYGAFYRLKEPKEGDLFVVAGYLVEIKALLLSRCLNQPTNLLT